MISAQIACRHACMRAMYVCMPCMHDMYAYHMLCMYACYVCMHAIYACMHTCACMRCMHECENSEISRLQDFETLRRRGFKTSRHACTACICAIHAYIGSTIAIGSACCSPARLPSSRGRLCAPRKRIEMTPFYRCFKKLAIHYIGWMSVSGSRESLRVWKSRKSQSLEESQHCEHCQHCRRRRHRRHCQHCQHCIRSMHAGIA